MYSIHSIGAIFNLCFIDEKNVVQINQGGNLANLIRNWATERISGNGKKKKKIRLEEDWRRAEHSPDTFTERMLTLPSAP